jgi:hypothetical protein
VTWAIDLAGGGAALLITLLLDASQRLLYIPGRSVYYASGSYRGDAKSAPKARRSPPIKPRCAVTYSRFRLPA